MGATTSAAPRHADRAELATPSPRTYTHRADLDGLRAVAILLVVAYHAEVPGFSAGFIGVDIFFVLSGFLITRTIDAEATTTGTIHLGRFWLRRARRLVPAATLTIVAIAVANQFILGPLELVERRSESLWAMAYLSNQHFAGEVTNYFNEGNSVSPFLHLWSLAVEEQFYLLWPIFFLVVSRVATPSSSASRATRTGLVGLGTAASLLLCISLTNGDSPLGFYSVISRAWEFGAGALLAMLLTQRTIPAWARASASAVGAVVLFVGLMVVSEDGFPGSLALYPVIATVLLIAAEPRDRVLGASLRSAPMQYIGRLSYSWYLAHWPVLVLGEALLDSSTLTSRLVLAVGSLIPAAAMHHLVENRIRFSPRLAGSARASVVAVGAILFSGFVVVGAIWVENDRLANDATIVMLLDARTDRTDVVGRCGQLNPDAILAGCSGGNPESDLVLVLGDSHAAHWIPGVAAASEAEDLRWAASVMGNCPSTGVVVGLQTERCTFRQQQIGGLLDDLAPRVVVISHSSGYLPTSVPLDDPASVAALADWSTQLEEFATDLDRRGIELLVVLDVPRFSEDPLECAAESGLDDCGLNVSSLARTREFHQAESVALERAGHGSTFDPLPWLCDTDGCPIIVDDVVAYADSHHLTATASTLAAKDLQTAITATLG